MIGETSTEVKGARDLHPNAVGPDGIENLWPSATKTRKVLRNGQMIIIRNNNAYNPLGTIITNIY